MRAVLCSTLTGPDALTVGELPAPSPGPGEVAVDVRAAGLNFPDVLLSYGKYQFKPTPPFVPGGELAGVVAEVGAGVTRFAKGDRVAGTLLHGAFAERVVLPEAACVAIPAEIPFETAAATLLTYVTTLHALEDRAKLRAGETMLVLGAAGGVGVAAIQLGKLLGARVLAAASTDEKVAFCRARGADEGIVYTREDLKERAKALTSGRGVDVVYDAVGGAYSEAALRAIAWEGRHLVVGFAAGDIPKIPLNLVLLKGCQIVGVFWGSFAMRDPTANRAHSVQLFQWISEGRLSPAIDEVFPFTRASEALQKLERREVKGKLVLAP